MEEIPFDDRTVPKVEVEWERSLWWWHPLTRAVHPAMRVTALATSAIAVLVLQLGLSLASELFQPRFIEQLDLWSVYFRTWDSLPRVPQATLELGQSMLFADLGIRELAYITFCLLWLTLVGGFFGGILSRRAAIELGQRTIAPWGETLRVVGSRWLSYLWVTGMHLVAIACLLAIPYLLGWISRIGPLAFVAGILLIACLPLVVMVGRLVLSMFICFPLAVTAISCEKKADAFDGFSRSNSYFFQRPVVAALCMALLLAVGWVGYLIIHWLLLAGWHWVRDAYLAGAGVTISQLIGQSAQSDSADQYVIGWVMVGGGITRWLIASYWFSYAWSAVAALYLILRKSVDNTDLDDIDVSSAGTPTSLPTLPDPPADSKHANSGEPAASEPAASEQVS